MNQNLRIKNIKDIVTPILRAYGFAFAGIFGSVARGEEKNGSDIDILVRVPGDRKFSMLDLIKAEDELTKALGKKVDLVTEGGVSPYMKKYIYQDIQIIYE